MFFNIKEHRYRLGLFAIPKAFFPYLLIQLTHITKIKPATRNVIACGSYFDLVRYFLSEVKAPTEQWSYRIDTRRVSALSFYFPLLLRRGFFLRIAMANIATFYKIANFFAFYLIFSYICIVKAEG